MGAIISAKWDDGSTALHWAAKAGNTEIIKQLLDGGADFANGNDIRRTPLHEAAASGND
ncbi:hypothetical protein K469DRAFT_720593 [Zopfia rhizophila CBS 207.26]|uniref:Uncharacterized protein n=1 Tax=Zopfia rhizophila CBS 207.26 TaxID=1314779 RepID=A0A6A6EKS4_9PEZI|nr:hypothetical protein K469DRAFT_720593 [Zopfia rhizophila CBS 207.26]